MQLYDADLYDTWVQITQGKVKSASATIRSRFGGDYVLTDIAHTDFIDQARDDPGLAEVFRDKFCIIYAVAP